VISLPRAWDTAAAALCACARALGDAREPAVVAAASGLAFRVTADDAVSLGAAHAWPWREELCAAAARLGYVAEVVASSEAPESALHAAAQARALVFARAGVQAGRPTLIWGVHAPEFGLVHGVDGERLRVSGILDGAAPETIGADELGRGDVPVVFALQLVGAAPVPADEAALATLRAALVLGRGPAPALAGFHVGLAAWDAMVRALERGVIDPAGLAYSAQRYAEARAACAMWLDEAARATGCELRAAQVAMRRAAGMLAELARLHPFPLPAGAMLTDAAREQARELVVETRRAEADALDAIACALAAHARAAAARVDLVDVAVADGGATTRSGAAALFACVRELPVVLDDETAACRERAPVRAKLAIESGRVVGQLLWAPLAESLYPVAADGARVMLFCPWVARERRGRGLGARLISALIADARAAGADGMLTLATGDERFLHAAPLEHLGFVEVDRRGDTRLLELRFTDAPSNARLVDPPPPHTAARALPVLVRHAYNCPLLLHTRRGLATAAAALAPRVALDERDATRTAPAAATIDDRPLLHGYVPAALLAAALRDRLA
jgi:GNAT superfamily N-acetyltransferase